MSNLWLMLSRVGTFMCVLLVFVVVYMRRKERNRPVALLQSQVGPVQSFDQRSLEGSAVSRVLMPGVKKIARVTPFDMAERINGKLVQAGNPGAGTPNGWSR